MSEAKDYLGRVTPTPSVRLPNESIEFDNGADAEAAAAEPAPAADAEAPADAPAKRR